MDKLMKAKAIMNRSDDIKRSDIPRSSSPQTMVQEFDVPNVKYNIPSEFMQENSTPQQPFLSSIPNTKPVGMPTLDAIKNSKLPDEIKKLMIEHPITQSQQPQTTLSNELIEKASRLMKDNNFENTVVEKTVSKSQGSNIDYGVIKKMIQEAVNDALKENGLIAESSEKSNETFSFKVGKHIFEGKVTKIKKLG